MPPYIDSAFFGSIIINGKKHSNDVIVHWDGEVHEKERTHEFSKRNAEDILLKNPDVIIVGTGNSGLLKIDPGAEVMAKVQGIELIAMKTPEAVREYNKLAKLRKKAVAVLHITC